MARRWQIITVELLFGLGQTFIPPPGRDLILPPSTTFEQLGLAIDRALGRWDLAHLREFTLADGTRITDEETRRMLHSGGFGEGILVERTADLGERVKKHVSVDDVFRYVFDLSDEWTCRCTMTGFGDPESLYGVVVSQPVPIWGWGRLPDQYGRDRRDSDEQPDASLSTQQKRAIRKETTAFVMDFGHMDPERLDPKDLRTARAAGDIGALLAVLAGVETGHVLQQVGQAFAEVWEHGAGPVKRRGRRGVERELESATMGLSNALSWRDRAGDAQLAAELVARLQGREPEGRPLPVDLGVLAETMALRDDAGDGAYLDLDTGTVLPVAVIAEHGGDPESGVEELGIEPGHEWIVLSDPAGAAASDRRDFVRSLSNGPTLSDSSAGNALDRAMKTRGTKKFYDTLDELDLVAVWRAFQDDRRWGRARAALAERGLRPVAPAESAGPEGPERSSGSAEPVGSAGSERPAGPEGSERPQGPEGSAEAPPSDAEAAE